MQKQLQIAVIAIASLTVSSASAEVDPKAQSKIAETINSGAVLVMNLRPVGASAEDAKTLTERVAEGLANRPGLKITTQADIKDVMALERTRQLLGCEDDKECLTELSRAAKSDYIVSGSLGKVGSSLVVSLVLLETKTSRPIRQVNENREKLSELFEEIPAMVGRLFGWEGVAKGPKFKLPEGKELSFAVFDIKPSGVSKELADNLTQVLSVEIKRVEGTKVIGKDDLAAIMSHERMGQLLGDECSTECFAEVGGALGVDKLIVGRVGKIGEKFFIALRMIDPVAVKVDSRITEIYRGTEDLMIRAMRHAGRSLLGLDVKIKGTLVVSASQNDATIFLNDKELGQHPLPPIKDIAVGRHSLRIAKEGYYDWLSDTYVDPSESTAMWAELAEQPERWYQKWWLWTIVGVVAAGGGTSAVLLNRKPPDTSSGDIDILHKQAGN